jgi:hypothetical protein
MSMKRQLSGDAGRTLGALFVLLVVACDTPKIQRPAAGPSPGRTDGGGTMVPLPDAGAGGGGGSGGSNGASCAEEAHRAERAPLDLMLLVDTSASMLEAAGNRSKWSMAHEALGAFVRDPGSAGLGVGLTFFPAPVMARACNNDMDCGLNSTGGLLCAARGACVGATGDPRGAMPCDNLPFLETCPAGLRCAALGRCTVSRADCVAQGAPCPGGAGDVCGAGDKVCRGSSLGGTNCEVGSYATPRVPVTGLPGGVSALAAALDGVRPAGGTPMGPAATGALQNLRAHLAASPGRRATLVMATDGLPMGCSADSIDAVATALQMGRAATPPISTYVIGVFAPMSADSRAALDRLATAGGSGTPFVIEPGQNLNQKFLEALNEIRGAALACEFQIPVPKAGTLDFGKVNVRYSGGAASEDLIFVGSADRCDPVRGGWHYDVSPATGTPTRIVVCESTCRKFKADAAGSVEVRVGCTSRID